MTAQLLGELEWHTTTSVYYEYMFLSSLVLNFVPSSLQEVAKEVAPIFFTSRQLHEIAY